MMVFSDDPQIAENQMHAIIFYLTAFGYIDGDFAATEKTFVREYIKKVIQMRVRHKQEFDPQQSRVAQVIVAAIHKEGM